MYLWASLYIIRFKALRSPCLYGVLGLLLLGLLGLLFGLLCANILMKLSDGGYFRPFAF